jgi:hypothetical protein
MVRYKIRFGAILASLALVVGGSLVGPPAQGALPSGCGLSASVPASNGTNVWSHANINCSSSRLLLARAAVDEQVGLVWNNVYGGWGPWQGIRGTNYSTTDRSVSCNGHGTDNWRGRAEGEVDSANNYQITSTALSITC